MPAFTIELFQVVELRPKGWSRDKAIGLDQYSTVSAEYKQNLNDKIFRRFYMHEIGYETVDMFRFAVNRHMLEVMPYWNQVIKSTQIQYDPLTTVNIQTLSTGETETDAESDVTATTNGTQTGAARAVASDFPQTALNASGDYASSGSDTNSRNTNAANNLENAVSNTAVKASNDSKTVGYQGLPSEIINAYRASILNVEVNILDSLTPLFMQVWNNGDEYTPHRLVW